jgi:hypothetical protein
VAAGTHSLMQINHKKGAVQALAPLFLYGNFFGLMRLYAQNADNPTSNI